MTVRDVCSLWRCSLRMCVHVCLCLCVCSLSTESFSPWLSLIRYLHGHLLWIVIWLKLSVPIMPPLWTRRTSVGFWRKPGSASFLGLRSQPERPSRGRVVAHFLFKASQVVQCFLRWCSPQLSPMVNPGKRLYNLATKRLLYSLFYVAAVVACVNHIPSFKLNC